MNRRVPATAISLLSLVLLAGCGVRDKIEQRINEEIAEKVIEVAAGGEVDVETRDGQVTVVGKDGSMLEADGNNSKVVVTNADGTRVESTQEVPKDFPIALPEVAKVINTTRVESPDKSKGFTLMFEATSNDLQALSKDIAADLEGKGILITRSETATGDGAMIMLAGKNEAGTLEANCMLSTSKDPEHPGVILMLNWTDRTAVTPG